jgi:uncharacterized protein (TIGR03083 family)
MPRRRLGDRCDPRRRAGAADTVPSMRLTPRYDDPSFLRLDLPVGDPAVPLVRQRARFERFLRDLDDASWQHPSRCEDWTVKDVVAHLVTTNGFWALSVQSALGGEPTRYLDGFDPVATPADLVEGSRAQNPAEVLDAFSASNAALADAVTGLGDDAWDLLGEAPPGHVPLRAIALHALWDSWIHERDVVVPLGAEVVEEPDEVECSLVYATALSPIFAVMHGTTGRGAIAVEATDPEVAFVVEVDGAVHARPGPAPAGSLRLTGPAVELVEGLSFRGPMPCPVDDEHGWLMGGLAQVFDRGQAPAGSSEASPR